MYFMGRCTHTYIYHYINIYIYIDKQEAMMGNGLGESSQKEDNGNISQAFFWGYNTDVIGDITN